MLTDLDRGLAAGILLSDGSFGGDGRQPHLILRKHVRHERLVRWLGGRFPGTRLYGPYTHGERSYFQWVARGTALVQEVMPAIEPLITEELDAHVASRIAEMRKNYAAFFARHERNPT